jgi:hypothetical protein
VTKKIIKNVKVIKEYEEVDKRITTTRNLEWEFFSEFFYRTLKLREILPIVGS